MFLSKKKKRRSRLSKSSEKIKKILLREEEMDFATEEAFNQLRTNITLSFSEKSKCRFIGITSSMKSEGKSFVSCCIANAISKTGKKVLLLDGDMRLPTIAKKLGIENKYPILIAEKTGPHFAFGDTCYSHCEDLPVYNPDGKEMIARLQRCPKNGGHGAHAARHRHARFGVLECGELLADLGGVGVAEPSVDIAGLFESEALCALLGGLEFKGRGLENRGRERRDAGDLELSDVDLLCCETAVLFHCSSSKWVCVSAGEAEAAPLRIRFYYTGFSGE